MEPHKAKKYVKIPTRFGQSFTHSSIINEEKELLSYKQALKASSAEKWLHVNQGEIQNLNDNEKRSLIKAPFDKKKCTWKKGFQN